MISSCSRPLRISTLRVTRRSIDATSLYAASTGMLLRAPRLLPRCATTAAMLAGYAISPEAIISRRARRPLLARHEQHFADRTPRRATTR